MTMVEFAALKVTVYGTSLFRSSDTAGRMTGLTALPSAGVVRPET